ncbi:MAG: ABC transporter permease [Halanaeroarchaeum sp.]
MRRRLRIARRTLASLRSEKTILLAVAIQLFVAAFSSFMVVGLVSLSDPGATQGEYTVDIAVSGDASDDLLAIVDESDARTAIGYDSRETAMTAFAAGRVDGMLHAEYGPDGRAYVEAIAPEGDFRTTLVVVQMKDALSELERDRRVALADRLSNRPLPIPDAPSSTPYVEFTYTVLVPVLAFLPAFISGSIAADSLAEEIERGTLELLRVAPVSTAAIVDGKALAMVAIAPAQAGLWLAFLSLNGTRIANPIAILVLVTGLAGVLVALGAGLAIVFRARTEAQLLYSFAALGLFAATMFLPENPANVVAKLAIGSATATTLATVVGLSAGAIVGYWFVRTVVERETMGE